MNIANVKVLHDVLTSTGWVRAGATVLMGAEEARALEASGKVDVLTVDGRPEVWAACCSGGEHDHA